MEKSQEMEALGYRSNPFSNFGQLSHLHPWGDFCKGPVICHFPEKSEREAFDALVVPQEGAARGYSLGSHLAKGLFPGFI